MPFKTLPLNNPSRLACHIWRVTHRIPALFIRKKTAHCTPSIYCPHSRLVAVETRRQWEMVWSEVPGMGDEQQLQTTHPREKIREDCSLTCSFSHTQINTLAHSRHDVNVHICLLLISIIMWIIYLHMHTNVNNIFKAPNESAGILFSVLPVYLNFHNFNHAFFFLLFLYNFLLGHIHFFGI